MVVFGINVNLNVREKGMTKTRTNENKHICSFTADCETEVHNCPHVEVSNHCKDHCWHGEM